MATSGTKRFEIWPWAIVGAFAAFMGFILWAVITMMGETVDLEYKDYYKREIAFQDQINKTQLTAQLGRNPEVKYSASSGILTVRFPADSATGIRPEGTLFLMRPSDAKLDREFSLSPDAGALQEIAVPGLKKGPWKLRVDWKEGDHALYHEETLIVGS